MTVNNGHGSTQSFAYGNIVFTDDIPNLSNDQRLPVLVTMTNLNGCLAMPSGSRSLTGKILLSNRAGAVAAFASTGMTDAQIQNHLMHLMGSDFNFEFSLFPSLFLAL